MNKKRERKKKRGPIAGAFAETKQRMVWFRTSILLSTTTGYFVSSLHLVE